MVLTTLRLKLLNFSMDTLILPMVILSDLLNKIMFNFHMKPELHKWVILFIIKGK